MRRTTAATTVALLLAASALTACTDRDDDCDDRSMAPAAVSAPLKPGPGARGSRGKAAKPKAKTPRHSIGHVHTHDYCDED
ncbi:hypothetical protein ADK47_28915 [Streptomyces rimosus subsp. rimosus]|nr:hypothetical protein DF17_22590 [Streptomyces rimosus]KOG70563.1 hypothetical protein ADK78_28690 [Kitasatospora aureofaciens]KOT31387.1 hypothetical protein ADK84_30205 [Streptomyces sp. NRRL WC-3701]KOT32246.1 hypothetical protein ADK42_26645 [Streptomyces rimosus subsp. rimosus]KEF19909.1 hypothetical protein DF18_13780 [Streptomyces rimosus]